jgi:hypothetical protein
VPKLNAIVEMNLPEQGISSPFRITSIKRLLPQKRPEDEDAGKGFVFRPVTGIFIPTTKYFCAPNLLRVGINSCVGFAPSHKTLRSESIHQSNDVWTLEFDSGDTLGVTANHPMCAR